MYTLLELSRLPEFPNGNWYGGKAKKLQTKDNDFDEKHIDRKKTIHFEQDNLLLYLSLLILFKLCFQV